MTARLVALCIPASQGRSNSPGGGAGANAQRGGASGTETERHAPGISTDKKVDDTK